MTQLKLIISLVLTVLIAGLLNPTPAASASDPGYSFFFTRSNGQPIGYDKCRPHPVLINPRGGTPEMVAAIKQALPRISRQTGYQFYFAGLTNLRWNGPTTVGEGFTTAPIRIGFSTGARTPQLAGRTAGWTSISQINRGGHVEIGRIRMVLDAGDYKSKTRRGARMKGPKGTGSVPYAKWFRQSLVPHEFGHVVGLNHTSRPNQLMSARVTASGFQAGDLRGIARLSYKSCQR
jgi:hypothetical protein